LNLLLNNLLCSGYTFDVEEDELKFKYKFFNSLLFLNMSLVCIATLVRYINGQYAQAFFDFTYVSLGIIVFFLSRLSKKYFKNLIYFVTFYSFVIVGFVVYNDANSYTSIGWLYVLLLTTSFLFEKENKHFIFIVFFLFAIFVEVIKNSHEFLEIMFSMIPFLVTIIFLYFFESKTENIKKQLQVANKLLKDHNLKLDEDVKTSQFEIFKFKQIFEKSPVAIIITDEKGDIEYVNVWFSTVSGYSLDEVLGKNPRVLKSELIASDAYAKLWSDISSGKVWRGTFKNISKSGKEYWESAIIAPIHNENGRLTNYIAIKQEITQSVYLNEQLKQKEEEIKENFEKSLESLVGMVEKRDTYTGGHSKRVAQYATLIAKQMNLSKNDCDVLYRASILHDIGKISTPDSVLLKPFKLTQNEYKIIQEHVTSSYDILASIPMYKELADVIVCHHERYDGKGYPRGISGDEIPLLSQIMIVADSFDAMVTNRIYKGRKSVLEAIDELKNCSGTQFHPIIVRSAEKALKNVTVNKSISQHPTDEIEKERFSYFYKDQVTGLNSAFYLEFLLLNGTYKKDFSFISVIYLHNFSKYNLKYGWKKGDQLLAVFSQYLLDNFKNTIIFRVFGDDFVLLSKEYLVIDVDELESLDILFSKNITISIQKFDFLFDEIDNINMLEYNAAGV